MRYVLGRGVRIDGHRIIGGSPPSVLRITEHGRRIIDGITVGNVVDRGVLLDRLLALGIVHPRPEPRLVTDADDNPLVTVVTPTLGAPRHVNDHGLGADGVIVVDDGSDPAVANATIRSDINLGPGGARNLGLAHVTTEFCAFVDADVDTGDGAAWLEALLGHFDDPRVAAVAPRVRSRDTSGVRGAYERRHGPLDMGDEPGPVAAGTRLGYVPSAALICRTEVIRSLGGFDATLRTGEDVDLIWRLVDAGHVVRYDPSVEVTHDPRATWQAWAHQRIGYGASTAPLARRHPGRLAPVVTSPWSAAACLAPLVVRRADIGIVISAGVIGIAGQRLSQRLPELDRATSIGTVALGTVRTADAIARATRRAWWPLVIIGMWWRPVRRLSVVALIAARSPLAALDDLIHGVGVWKGMYAERSIAPLLPRFVSGRPERHTTSTYHLDP